MGKTVVRKNWKLGLVFNRSGSVLLSLFSLMVMSGNAGALEINTGNEDVVLRFDNTIKYNLAQRLKGQDQRVIKNPNTDDGDRNFDVGIVSNRLDILSELDLGYKKDYGIRLSSASWYDQQYHKSFDNTSLATSNHLGGGLNDYAKKYYAGPGAELLDAFVYSKVNIGDIPVNIKAGRHTVFWGESLLSSGAINSVSYSQMPLDLAKSFASPGIEAKELFRPLNAVTVQAQPIETLSIAAQYFLQWEATRLPEAGTYYGFSDIYQFGDNKLLAGPAKFSNGDDIEPHQAGAWGVAARWRPEWLDGTVGLYYRKFSDMLPQAHLKPAAGKYYLAYADNIDLYGVSLAKDIFGISVGSEFSMRKNMPLISDTATVIGNLPASGDTLGARGETMHALINFMGVINQTPIFDSASWNAEFTWMHLNNVSQGANLFKGRSSYTAIDKVDKNSVTVSTNFAPTWYQVYPGVDLSMPTSFGIGISGNAAVVAGGSQGSGSWSTGLAAEIYTKYKVNLTYSSSFGIIQSNASGVLTAANGPSAYLKDRDLLALTLKTTF